MTLSSTSMRISYSGNGVTTDYSFPYYFLSGDDLKVYIRDTDDVETLLTIGSDYTVSGAGETGGGTVEMVTIPATGETLVIFRDPAITQTTDYVDGDPFGAATSETALDKRTMVEQRLNDLSSRSLRLHETDTIGGGAYNALGNRISNALAGTVAGDVATIDQIASITAETIVEMYSTRNAAEAATISASVTWLRTQGYGTVGDGGGALYKKVLVSTTTGEFTSADGAIWQLSGNDIINVNMFGADPSGAVDSTTAFNDALTYTVNADNGQEVFALGTFEIGPLDDPNGPVVLKINGTINLTDTFEQIHHIHVIGIGGPDTGVQFQVGPVATINCTDNGNTGWRISGSGNHYLANLRINADDTAGIGLLLDGSTALGALCRLDNVSVINANGTNPDPTCQVQNFFWVWGYRCRFLTNSACPKALSLTNVTASFGGTGIIYFDDLIFSGGGVYIDAPFSPGGGGPIGNCFFRQVTHENGIAPSFTLDAVMGVEIDGCVVADSISGGGLLFKGTNRNIQLRGTNDLIPTIELDTGASISGLVTDCSYSNAGFRTNTALTPQNVIGNDGDFILGALSNIGDTMSPALVPLAPVALNEGGQDASAWPAAAVSQGGNVTAEYGFQAPDGTFTAGKITAVAGEDVFIYDQRNYTPAVGDYVIFGGWLRNPTPTVLMQANALSILWTSASVIFDNDTKQKTAIGPGWFGSTENNSWVPYACMAQVTATPGGVQELKFVTRVFEPTRAPVISWHPWYYYIPVGTMPTDDVIRLYQTLRRGPVNAQIGDVALLDHHKLMLGGGARLDSRSAEPVKLLYRVGDRTFDLTAATDGWTCTTDGGAKSATRANLTPYTVGTWVLWTTGTTVWECTVAGTSAAAPPSIVGLVVGSTVVDATVTWTMRSLTTAVFRTGL